MTTIARNPDPALPPGADPESDGWEIHGSAYQRLVWSTPMPLPEHLASHDVRVVVTQIADGTLINNHDDDQPLVYYGSEDYLPADARLIAQALNAAADLADFWGGGGRRPVELLADAFSALRAAHSQLATLPGNADSYVRAALDSISDAADALR